jgi:hypothetical protein
MSDFYQILKREIEPNVQPVIAAKDDGQLKVEKKVVENSIAKNDLPTKRKISPLVKIKKNKLIKTKKSRSAVTKDSHEKKIKIVSGFLASEQANPIWLTLAETGKLGGLQKRTIKRALRSGHLKYRIIEGRYQVDLRSALLYFFSKRKLWNKLLEFGLGQYVEKWKN